ncbi:MAG: YceI family protein [Pseudomonadota bacterium]
MKTSTLIALSSLFAASSGVHAEENADDRGLSTLPSGTYVMDKTHGYVTFSYSHMGFSNPVLRFDDVDAEVSLVADKLSGSTLKVLIDPASINTAVPKFDDHLKGKDFFDVTIHKEVTFTSTSISFETPYSGTLTGDLTVKGITKPVTLDVTLNKAAPHPFKGVPAFGITATGQVDRQDFDLSAYVPNVGAVVDLRIEAEFAKSE